MIITIDGPAGSGKSTIAQGVSAQLGLLYLDTGALYRTIGYFFWQKGHLPAEPDQIADELQQITVCMDYDGENIAYMLNNQDVSALIRTKQVAHYASVLSQYPLVREKVNAIARRFSAGHDVVAEGRDTGSVVFPTADVKFYLTASLQERARRRVKDYSLTGNHPSLQEVADELHVRDNRDSNREVAPLVQPDDAYRIDTTDINIAQTIAKVLSIINEKISVAGGFSSKMTENNEHKEDVIKKEESTDNGTAAEDTQQSFEQMMADYEKSLNDIRAGAIIKGKIVRITESDVFVDIGYKSEAIVPVGQFQREIELQDKNFAEGGEIYVLIEKTEERHGYLRVSKTKADRIKHWESLKDVYEAGGTVKGKVIAKGSKGGYIVDVGVKAFLPSSQVGRLTEQEKESMLNSIVETKIIGFEPRKKSVILSRRQLLHEQREAMKKELLGTLEKEQMIKGTVKKIIDSGAFIALGGIDGFLPKNYMTWGRLEDPRELFEEGQEIEVLVKEINRKRERITLSYKEKTADPWLFVKEKYSVGQRIEGKVVSIKNFGLFVELEPGIEGLVHNSELSWEKLPKNPSHYAALGDVIPVEILRINETDRRIGLSLRACQQNPWEKFGKEHPVGSVISGEINNITNFGAFVKLPGNIEGLIYASQVTWDKSVKEPQKQLKVGEAVEVKVVDIDTERKRISLSLKQMQKNPFDLFIEDYKVGDVIYGTVTQWQDFGCFVNVSENVDGLLHISQIPHAVVNEHPKLGQELEMEILRIDKKNKKLSLSIWALFLHRYSEDSIVNGLVSRVADQGGVFIEIMPAVEAYINQGQIAEQGLGIGDTTKAVISKIDRNSKSVYASIKRLESKKEQEAYQDYLKKLEKEQNEHKHSLLSKEMADTLLKKTKKE